MNAVDGVGNTPVHTACHRGSLKSVITLLKYGSSNIHAKNKDGWSSIHFAAREGHIEIIRSLLKYKANIDEGDNRLYTAMSLAASNGRLKCVQLRE